jgi:N-acetylneuraminic acid mutarotase
MKTSGFSFQRLALTAQLCWVIVSASQQASNQLPKCWKSIAPISGGTRQEHSVGTIGTDIYVVGGLKGASATGAVEKYDTTTNKWMTVAPLPLPVHHPNIATADGKLYLLGSLADGSKDGARWPALANSYSYNPASNTWTQLAPMPDARGSSALGVYGKTIFVAGGLSRAGKAVDTVSSFDTVTGKWTSLPSSNLPEARDHGGGGVVGNTFYVVGGRIGSQNTVRGTTFALDVSKSGGKWTDVAKMPTPRGGIAVAVQGTKIYAIGGEGNPAAGTRGVFSDVEVFDTVQKTWSKETTMKTPRHGNGAAAMGDRIYVLGGGLKQGGGAAVDESDSLGPGPC